MNTREEIEAVMKIIREKGNFHPICPVCKQIRYATQSPKYVPGGCEGCDHNPDPVQKDSQI